MPFAIGSIPRPKLEKHLPIVLEKDEVVSILDAVDNVKHKAMLMLIYSGGLRVGEAVRLRVEDIDSKRKLIYLRSAKGKSRRDAFGKRPIYDSLRCCAKHAKAIL